MRDTLNHIDSRARVRRGFLGAITFSSIALSPDCARWGRQPRQMMKKSCMFSSGRDAEVHSRVSSMASPSRRWLVLVPILFAAACSHPTVSSRGIPSAGEWRTFEGTWSASGTRQTLNLETNHHASIFDLTGSLLLIGDQGLGVGFQAQAIGFTDSLAGMQGRCVWTDERGDRFIAN